MTMKKIKSIDIFITEISLMSKPKWKKNLFFSFMKWLNIDCIFIAKIAAQILAFEFVHC